MRKTVNINTNTISSYKGRALPQSINNQIGGYYYAQKEYDLA